MTTRTTKLLQQWPKPLHLQIQTWSNLTHALAIIKPPVSISCADMKPIQSSAFCSITGWLTALCRLVKHYANCTTTIKLRNVSLLCANVLEVQYNQVLWYYWHVRQQNLRQSLACKTFYWTDNQIEEPKLHNGCLPEKFIISISRIYLLVSNPWWAGMKLSLTRELLQICYQFWNNYICNNAIFFTLCSWHLWRITCMFLDSTTSGTW